MRRVFEKAVIAGVTVVFFGTIDNFVNAASTN